MTRSAQATGIWVGLVEVAVEGALGGRGGGWPEDGVAEDGVAGGGVDGEAQAVGELLCACSTPCS